MPARGYVIGASKGLCDRCEQGVMRSVRARGYVIGASKGLCDRCEQGVM